ncbi:MAG: M20 aminoacylase family protein [Pseudooceanicola sp.]
MPIRNRFAELQSEITAWRRDFHEHPELLYDVHRTAGIVAEKLRAFGCDQVVEGIGKTGVVGVIKGKSDSKGKVIGLRADMDALPLDEVTGLPHASKTPGKMHACGHDGHTAILLGAAQYLAETRNFDGTVVVMFQPAEEGGGGALAMCEDGVLDDYGIQEVYGLHNMPGLPVGQFAIKPGALLASADQFDMVIEGKGSHAAQPHNGIDTVLAASQVVTALQSVVSRNLDPIKSLVVSVTSFRTLTDAYNILPDSVALKGTVRALDPAARDMAEERIRAIATSTAEAMGCRVKLDYVRGYPVTMNAEENTDFASEAARAVAGESGVTYTPPHLGAEDFSYMLERRPGAYIMLGNGDSAALHNPAYEFDDTAIPVGCSWFAEMVERRMPAA